jgi:hypothetical protein
LETLQKDWNEFSIDIIHEMDSDGLLRLVICTTSVLALDSGYVYIDENIFSKGLAKAKCHHHLRFI